MQQGRTAVGYEGLTAWMDQQERRLRALEAENRELRRQLEELRRGVGIELVIEGRTVAVAPLPAVTPRRGDSPAGPYDPAASQRTHAAPRAQAAPAGQLSSATDFFEALTAGQPLPRQQPPSFLPPGHAHAPVAPAAQSPAFGPAAHLAQAQPFSAAAWGPPSPPMPSAEHIAPSSAGAPAWGTSWPERREVRPHPAPVQPGYPPPPVGMPSPGTPLPAPTAAQAGRTQAGRPFEEHNPYADSFLL